MSWRFALATAGSTRACPHEGEGRQSASDRRTGRRKNTFGVSHRPRTRRKRLARAVHPNLRPGAEAQVARRELALEAAINRLDRFHLLILDDLAYVSKDQAETSVLFELIGARYERRSTLVTANQPFGDWGKIFQDPAMTLAAVDRLIHHATIFEMNVESYRRRAALDRKQKGAGRPPNYATINDTSQASRRDNQADR
jgi:hypothetical protein